MSSIPEMSRRPSDARTTARTAPPRGAPPPTPPERIGRYRILRQIGSGGMGAVYEAEQENPRRVVALKVIRASVLSADTIRRFSQEAHVLGRLQHPGIAQIYEAGVAQLGDESQPFFAMEYVRGRGLLQYAAEQKLGIRERLELLVQIGDAVQHAHERGVIHRDLKPANILVNEHSKPKVLDFGVARATDADLQATTIQTDIGQLVGTIPYMSPEQAGGDSRELDARSDVYALGVVAYELLTGRLPYEIPTSIPLALRVIREEEPSRMHRASRGSGRSSHLLQADVETVVFKALAKEKSRRYASVAEFAADLTRILKSEPITARPPSTWYQLRKFAARNRALVAGVFAVLITLSAGLAATTMWAVRATRAERRASDAAAAEQIANAKARQAERQVRRRLAESQAQAGKLAASRGNWAAALRYYDEALRGVYPDRVELELGRVEALFSLYRDHEALALAERLYESDDVGRHRGAMLLWLGFLTMNLEAGGTDDGIEWIREALETGQLDPSAEAFARGLIAETMPEAAEHFRAALREDPFNRPAVVMLGLIDLILGRVDEGRQVVEQALTLQPQDPVLHTLHAILAVFSWDDTSADASLAKVAQVIDADQYAALAAALDGLREARDSLAATSRLGARDSGAAQRVALGILNAALAAQRATEDATNPLTRIGSMLPPSVANLRDAVAGMFMSLSTGRKEAAIEFASQCVRIAPCGQTYLMQGAVLIDSERWREAGAAFQRAMDAPSLFDVRCAATIAALASAFDEAFADSARQGGAVKQHVDIEVAARLARAFRDSCFDGESSPPPDYAYRIAQVLSTAGEAELARQIAVRALEADPDDAQLRLAKAIAEYHLGAYVSTIATVGAILEQDPSNTEALRLRRRAVEGLKYAEESLRTLTSVPAGD